MMVINRSLIATTLLLLLAGSALAPPVEAGGAARAALDYLQQHRKELRLAGSDIDDVVVSSQVTSRHNGVTHVYLQQRHRGIEVHNAILTVNVGADGTVISTGSRFFRRIASAAGGQSARKAAAEAAESAAHHLKIKPANGRRALVEPFEVLSSQAGPDAATTLSDGGIASRPIEAKLVWLPKGRAVRLAWKLEIEEVGGAHWWNAFVDAATGEFLAVHDLVVQDSPAEISAAIARPDSLNAAALPAFADLDGSSYNVFALPFESPNDGDRTLVNGAAAPAASPHGWHDTNGTAGAEFTVTRGNNAHAYTDLDANNVADPGSNPDGGAALDFDFPLDLTLGPETYRPFAVTNLFYWNNIMHDVTFGYGFDEAAGNFQVTNYSLPPGTGNDDVRAEAQDGSGTNNANFATPAQNAAVPRPRMQMFVWTHPTPNLVTVNNGPIAGDYIASRATFGPQLPVIGPVTGPVVLVDDEVEGVPVPPAPAGTVNDGCEPFTVPAGSLALLDRGFCTFAVKVDNAETAGAAGVIVANNAAGPPITMGFTPPIPPINIPAVMVSQVDGNLFKVNLPFGGTLSADPALSINRDSDLDAGVIAHEYGHGISNRLTGGPNNVACLQNAGGNSEQMGEGWSDWFAMTLTTHPADTRLTPRGVGPYLVFEPADGPGIRPTPYTTDMTVNPSTYASVADVANISQPHGIGYVWNTMLWEMYWNLVDRYGYNADVYGDWTTGGNNLALQLVMDGMKFQPCQPGFVDGRNAILAADVALPAADNQCEIWRAFAKRGLGASASQGSPIVRTDGVPAFDLPASCLTAVFGGFSSPVDDPPEVNDWTAGDIVPLKFTLSGMGTDLLIDSQPVDCDTLLPTGEAPVAATSPSGLKKKGNEYRFNWQTDASWAGTCRRLTIRIPAPSDAVAYFSFN